MNPVNKQLQQAIKARHPLIFLKTPEEARVLQALTSLAKDTNTALNVWTCTNGFDNTPESIDTCDPVTAVQWASKQKQSGFYVFKDLTAFMNEPILVRALRDSYEQLRKIDHAYIFIMSSVLEIPESLKRHIYIIEISPPNSEELLAIVKQMTAQYTQQEIPLEFLRDIALSLSGITLDETRHILHSVLSGAKLSKQHLLDNIRFAKKALVTGADFLEYVASEQGLDQVGGLANFKSWMKDRAKVFNQQAIEANVPIPGGILIMGVSGCGKSLCAKAIANVWNVPLFRLDMNLIFSGLYGNPEASFFKVLKMIETTAPAVLWIDEIENGLGFSDKNNPMQSHIFSAFLTWMQEKPPLVFVAATANRIESLPAEMIRKGRFDQVFFVDLPTEKERTELFEICLRQNGADPKDFDMRRMLLETKDWNGAEIAQVVQAARIHGYHHKRDFTTQDIIEQAEHIVPLSRTMSEQIKALKDWAWDRATPASADNDMQLSIDSN